MDEAAVLDAPELETPEIDSPDTTEADSTSADTSTPGAEGAEQEHEDLSGQPLIDGNRLRADAKATLQEIKAKNPGLARELYSALFRADELKREFPGGLTAVKELHREVEQIGGLDRIRELQSENAEWAAVDQLFVSGDPKLIENMAEQNPEAFLSIAPAAMNKFAQMNAEGYAAYVSQVFLGDMQANGIQLSLERLQDFIGDNPRAAEVLSRITGYVNRLGQLAQKPISKPMAAPASKKPAGAEAEQTKFQQERQQFEREKWKTETAREQEQVFGSEWARIEARKPSDSQKAAIRELFASRFGKTVEQNREKMERYFKAGDREGFQRFASSLTKTELPKILQSSADSVLGASKKAPAAQQKADPAPKVNGATTAHSSPGYLWVGGAPKRESVDMSRTSSSMWTKHQAILRDGKRVQWK